MISQENQRISQERNKSTEQTYKKNTEGIRKEYSPDLQSKNCDVSCFSQKQQSVTDGVRKTHFPQEPGKNPVGKQESLKNSGENSGEETGNTGDNTGKKTGDTGVFPHWEFLHPKSPPGERCNFVDPCLSPCRLAQHRHSSLHPLPVSEKCFVRPPSGLRSAGSSWIRRRALYTTSNNSEWKTVEKSSSWKQDSWRPTDERDTGVCQSRNSSTRLRGRFA